MEDLNNVSLVCRLGRDPEVRHTASGDPVASLWVAVNGRKEDDTSWLSVSLWGKQAEAAEKFLTKGRRIGIKGRLRSREWQAQDGTKRREVEVVADSFYFLDSKQDGAAPADLPVASAPPRSDDSDIPFAMSAV